MRKLTTFISPSARSLLVCERRRVRSFPELPTSLRVSERFAVVDSIPLASLSSFTVKESVSSFKFLLNVPRRSPVCFFSSPARPSRRQRSELTDVTAKVVIHEAFVEGSSKRLIIWRAQCTISTFSRNTTNSVRGRSGACRMRLRQHSRNSTRFLNSRRLRNWASSWRLAARSRSKLQLAAPAGPPVFLVIGILLADKPWGMACRCGSLIAVLTPKRWRRKRTALWKEECDMKALLWIGLQMPGADMTPPSSSNGIFTDILCNE
jgi:hypothetical protein